VIGMSVKVMRIATAEETEDLPEPQRIAAGKRGASARAKALTAEQRAEIARTAASARWKKG
jgi:hypothetical protein